MTARCRVILFTFVKLPKQELIHENVIQFFMEKFTVEMAIELSQRHENFLVVICIYTVEPYLVDWLYIQE